MFSRLGRLSRTSIDVRAEDYGPALGLEIIDSIAAEPRSQTLIFHRRSRAHLAARPRRTKLRTVAQRSVKSANDRFERRPLDHERYEHDREDAIDDLRAVR